MDQKTSRPLRRLLVGAKGAVGQQVLANPRVSQLVAITRRALPAQARLINLAGDFDALQAFGTGP